MGVETKQKKKIKKGGEKKGESENNDAKGGEKQISTAYLYFFPLGWKG